MQQPNWQRNNLNSTRDIWKTQLQYVPARSKYQTWQDETNKGKNPDWHDCSIPGIPAEELDVEAQHKMLDQYMTPWMSQASPKPTIQQQVNSSQWDRKSHKHIKSPDYAFKEAIAGRVPRTYQTIPAPKNTKAIAQVAPNSVLGNMSNKINTLNGTNNYKWDSNHPMEKPEDSNDQDYNTTSSECSDNDTCESSSHCGKQTLKNSF